MLLCMSCGTARPSSISRGTIRVLIIFLLPERQAIQLNDTHSLINELKHYAESSQNLFDDKRVLGKSFHNFPVRYRQIFMRFRYWTRSSQFCHIVPNIRPLSREKRGFIALRRMRIFLSMQRQYEIPLHQRTHPHVYKTAPFLRRVIRRNAIVQIAFRNARRKLLKLRSCLDIPLTKNQLPFDLRQTAPVDLLLQRLVNVRFAVLPEGGPAARRTCPTFGPRGSPPDRSRRLHSRCKPWVGTNPRHHQPALSSDPSGTRSASSGFPRTSRPLFRPAKPEIHAAGMTNVAVWISVLCRMQPSLPSPRSLLVPGAAVRAAALLHHHAAGLSVSRMAAPGTRHQTKLQVKCTCSLVWYCTVYCT